LPEHNVPDHINDVLGEVCAEIERLAERIGDLAVDELRRAVSAGEEKRPELERRLTRVRHGLERAAHLLGGRDGDDDG
jgi:hypothetical protein